MNLNKYQELSKRTMPYNGAPANQVEFENMLGNYAMGLVGEWFELQVELSEINKTNINDHLDDIEKEGGDVLHYAVGLLALLGETDIPVTELKEVDYRECEKALVDLLEIPKKHIYHRHELKRDELVKAVHVIINSMNYLFNKSLPNVLQMNIDKLKKRYPESFNSQDSINRTV